MNSCTTCAHCVVTSAVARTQEEPNSVDPQGGWLDSHTDYHVGGPPTSGRRRMQSDTYHLWTKSVSGGDRGDVYVLFHTVHLGWGYV